MELTVHEFLSSTTRGAVGGQFHASVALPPFPFKTHPDTHLVGIWEFSFSPPRPDRLWDPLNLLSSGYRGSFPGVKRSGREADHSPPSNAEFKNVWSYISIHPYVFMSWYLVKQKDNFYLYFLPGWFS
jgi:hypothetical protein